MQGEYRPLRSKYSLCCSVSWWSTPIQSCPGGGRCYLIQFRPGGVPIQSQWGYSPSGSGWGTPGRDMGLGTVYPLKRTWDQWMEVLWDGDGGTVRVNRQKPVKTVPSHSFGMWAVKIAKILRRDILHYQFISDTFVITENRQYICGCAIFCVYSVDH